MNRLIARVVVFAVACAVAGCGETDQKAEIPKDLNKPVPKLNQAGSDSPAPAGRKAAAGGAVEN